MSGETLLWKPELSLALLVELIPRCVVASLHHFVEQVTLGCGNLLQVSIVPFRNKVECSLRIFILVLNPLAVADLEGVPTKYFE